MPDFRHKMSLGTSANFPYHDENDLVLRSRCKYVHLKTHWAPPPNNALKSWGNFTAIALQQNKFYSIGHRSPVLLDCIQLLHFIHITTYFLFWSNQVLLNWRPAVQRSFPQWWVFSDRNHSDNYWAQIILHYCLLWPIVTRFGEILPLWRKSIWLF